jgi:hypothetical protein
MKSTVFVRADALVHAHLLSHGVLVLLIPTRADVLVLLVAHAGGGAR